MAQQIAKARRTAAARPRPFRGPLGAALFLLGATLACAGPGPDERGRAPLAASRLVDLSHAYDETTIFWPTEEGFALEPGPHGVTEAGHWYAANRFRSAEHGGTHLDAPYHFAREGLRADQVPLASLIGPAVVVDVSEACARDADHAVGPAALEAWEAEHGPLPEGAIVLLRTGFGRFWPDRSRYLGSARRGPEAVAELHFPGLGEAAARWLVARRVRAVGIDTASIDPGQSRDFAAHVVLAAADVPVLENLARLEQLPARDFEVVALPMKIAGGSGAPVRAVAVLPDR